MAIPPAAMHQRPKGRSLGSLKTVWKAAKNYPGHLVGALLALLVAAGATSGVPYAFKLIIDRGFGADGSGGDIASARSIDHHAAQAAFAKPSTAPK